MKFTPPQDPFAHKSSRHHYVPLHYLKGFTDNEGMLYVYDKQKDTIRRGSPKSCFYEIDRNSVENKKGEKSSVLEEGMYGAYDSLCAPVLAKFRNEPNNEDLLSTENVSILSIFVITLFWRSPKLDKIFKDLFKRGDFKFYDADNNEVNNPELAERYKNDEQMMKVHKSGVFVETVKRLKKTGAYPTKLYDRGENVFLTSDLPLLYALFPNSLEAVKEYPFFLPISSRRVFYTVPTSSLVWDLPKIIFFNASIIDQSHRYVCGSDKVLLQECVKYYKDMKAKGLLDMVRYRLFSL